MALLFMLSSILTYALPLVRRNRQPHLVAGMNRTQKAGVLRISHPRSRRQSVPSDVMHIVTEPNATAAVATLTLGVIAKTILSYSSVSDIFDIVDFSESEGCPTHHHRSRRRVVKAETTKAVLT